MRHLISVGDVTGGVRLNGLGVGRDPPRVVGVERGGVRHLCTGCRQGDRSVDSVMTDS